MTDSVLEIGGREQNGDDSSEGVDLVSLDHLGEHLVDVVGELDETNSLGGEISQDGVSTFDGFNGGVEFFVDQSFIRVVFSKSLRSQTGEDFLDGRDVVSGFFQISLG